MFVKHRLELMYYARIIHASYIVFGPVSRLARTKGVGLEMRTRMRRSITSAENFFAFINFSNTCVAFRDELSTKKLLTLS